MAVLAVICGVLGGPILGPSFSIVGAAAGALVGVRVLGGAARRDSGVRSPGTGGMVLVPVAVVVGMFLLPRLFDVIGLTLGWGLAAGASAFIAAAGFVTSRSDEIWGASR